MANPFQLLIVEDDDDARSNMVDILSLDGYDIETASHCLPAISLLSSKKYGAVIVDWRLPDGSGGDLFPIIFKHQIDTPVIVVTGMREFDVAVTALRQGAYDFLLKPINADALRAVLHRVVERAEHLHEIKTAQSKLVQNERLAAIGQMVTGLAHESRNSLQCSHACLANLSLDVAEMPGSLELVGKIRNSLDDLSAILEEVRDYAAPIVLERSETNLLSLVKESWQKIINTHIEASHVNFEIESQPPEGTLIKADARRLGQVLWNLFENALSAIGAVPKAKQAAAESAPGQASTKISIQICQLEEHVRLNFFDSGGGVDAEHLDSIFDPFFTTKTKGTGLGLAISRRIVEAHGGIISYISERDKMGHFSVQLPLSN